MDNGITRSLEKSSKIQKFYGTGDSDGQSDDLLDCYRNHRVLKCKLLSLTLTGSTMTWFKYLPDGEHIFLDRSMQNFHRSKEKTHNHDCSQWDHIRDEDSLLTDSKDIDDHAVKYFETLFSSNVSVLQDFALDDDTISPLAKIMHFLISNEKRGFIHGRHIHGCIELASEAFNLLDSKAWCGNATLKLDITKAFDILSWDFLLKVLHKFGFNDKFCLWINNLFHSMHMSVNVNGALHGYFSCSCGVRQGDPLSLPLCFFLAEEVLSRKLLQLAFTKKLGPIQGPNNISVPSNILYVDDVFIFCKGKISNIKILISTFEEYAKVSGQMVNCDKSFIFGGGMSSSRLNILVEISGFKKGFGQFVYLDVPIFKGKLKVVHLRTIVDKVTNMLASWRGYLLSFYGRVELVKSVVSSMFVHSMVIYDWTISHIRDIERAMKRFIWSGETTKNKVINVVWKKICYPLDEGGLRIRSLIKVNEAYNLKLAWDLHNSPEPWATLLRHRVLRKRKIIKHHIYSSL
ncbi:unnamed protein product [Vicia faba]|uniref:Reverse transcriptase domain-containing protein n=1 Tax=Vicia faba TaxID=3906 RepID=A0AAV0YJI7_VICFA|nr:unnamed protein product [Vicia faba]